MNLRCLAAALLLVPTAALAFEAADVIPYPSTGVFPAYPRESIGAPLELSAQAGVMHDNNVLRRPTGEETENILRYGVGARYDQRVYGRQSIFLDARGEFYDYTNFSDLDHFAYGLLGEWRWETVGNLSGTLGYERRRYQADISESQAAVQDLITGNRYYGTAAWRFGADWRLRGAVEGTDSARPSRRASETQSTSYTVGLDYVTVLANTLGVEYRKSYGDAPVSEEIDPLGVFVANDYDEETVSLVAVYNLGSQLRARGRVGNTKRTYTQVAAADFDGTTWRAGIDWLPSPKVIIAFETYKEPRSVIDLEAHHSVLRGWAFGPSWSPTAKLSFYARYIEERRTLGGDSAEVLSVTLLDETVRTVRFGAGWEPRRFWFVGAAVETGERTSNELGRDYDYAAFMLNVRFAF
jgi:hypothetical protein